MSDAPRLKELIVGPFRGFAIYPRVARLRVRVPLSLLVLATLVCGLGLTAQWTLKRQAWLDDARQSSLWLMPRVTISDGHARVASDARLIDAVHFLVWLDPSTNTLAFGDVPMSPGETRPVVHVGDEMLVIHRPGRAPTPLPWTVLEARYGSMSLDGTEVADWLGDRLPTAAAGKLGFGFAFSVAWQLLLLVAFAALYRVIFYRGLYVPPFHTLVAVGAVAALPALAAATVAGSAGATQGGVITVHALALGVLFLTGATRVRLGDEEPA